MKITLKMKLPSMQTLQKIALYTGAVGLTAAVLVQLNRQEKVAESPYFREAFKVLRAHEGAKKHLGEPIKQLGFKASDPNNFSDGERAHFACRVKGPLDKGKVYFWAKVVDGKWTIEREELEVNKQPDKRLVIVADQQNKTE